MRGSYTGNISIAIPTQSRLNTMTEFQDRSVVFEDNNNENIASRKDETRKKHQGQAFMRTKQIQKWLDCRNKVSKKYTIDSENLQIKPNTCYMLSIQDIGEVQYRKKIGSGGKQARQQNQAVLKNTSEPVSKLYLKIVANLVSPTTQDYHCRSVEPSIIELQQKSSSFIYQVAEPSLALFFYSKLSSGAQFKIRVQVSVAEVATDGNTDVVLFDEYIGFCDIDVFKGVKSKQKVQLYSAKNNISLDTYIAYNLIISDSLKVLQKLIPPNCLITSQQALPGLAGRKLPSNPLTLGYPLEFTELHSVRIDIASVDISDSIINSKLKQACFWARITDCNNSIEDIYGHVKEVRLNSIFHNGWTVFCDSSIKLLDKMEIQKKNSKKPSAQIVKFINYSTDQLCTIPFIFFDEQAILLFQINVQVQIRKRSNTQFVQNLTLPLCYGHFKIQKVSNDEKNSIQMYQGDGVTVSSQKFQSRATLVQGSKLDFYITIQNANKNSLKNVSMLNSNILGLNNKSMILNNEVDRVILQKQRMIRQNRKLKNFNKIKKIQLSQQVPILDTTVYQQKLYKGQIQKIRRERKEKQEVLEYLKRKVKQLGGHYPQEESQSKLGRIQQINIQDNFHNLKQNTLLNYHNSNFYKAAFQKYQANANYANNNNRLPVSLIKLHSFSIFSSPEIVRVCQSGEVPLELLKTQLLQKNYGYGIFINFISLLPAFDGVKLPRKIYFMTRFFTHQQLKSCQCTIDETNGQIIIPQDKIVDDLDKGQGAKLQSKSKSKKIIYVQIMPEQQVNNKVGTFIQFVSYLYHSDIQIKIIDSLSNMEFGQCYCHLRDILRMRRNQASLHQDCWITKHGRVKAKLKLQLKSIRREPQPSQQSKIQRPVSRLQAYSMQPQCRQLQRIAQYKKIKQSAPSNLLKIQRILNEQLTKEQIFVNVFRMKGQIFKLELRNNKKYTEKYRLMLNDPDVSYLAQEEIVLVNKKLYQSMSATGWYSFIQKIQNNLGVTIVDDDGCVEVNAQQSISIMFYYYSERKYEPVFETKQYLVDQQQLSQLPDLSVKENITSNSTFKNSSKFNPLLKVYNHQRCVTLSVLNSSSLQIVGLHKINIIPKPDTLSYISSFVRKNNSKAVIEVPYIANQNFVVYIDDPTVISTLNQSNNTVQLQCFVGEQQKSRSFNVSILSPFPQNRLLVNYQLWLWGANQIDIQGSIWEQQQIIIQLHNFICLKKELKYILAFSEDERVINIRQKNPIKINSKQSKTLIRVKVTPNQLLTEYYQLSILSPIDYSLIYRYILKVSTPVPQISQRITLRIKLNDKMIQEPFSFKNEQQRKQKYAIFSDKPHILWCAEESIQIQGRAEKNIKININAQQVLQHQQILLGLFAQKSKIYFVFVLQLDNIL